ncbi:hypothetical protein LFYK43_02060 [Ligilactobacillus salitolerans]|uniref:Uncharacterized protein n=1 Tax=Ligilactobacillus salitolerans TaxID=1808352 RepID=A0A401IQD1_9LACO|nr:hypothetical protein [Ligilactobacillus salitolerans]GBG93747.1 hypothetical protein LFYK43_02060 [Ligilactobacillus salitolerans]
MKIQFQLATVVLAVSVVLLVFSLNKLGYGILLLAQILYFDPLTDQFVEKGLGRLLSIILAALITLLVFVVIAVGAALVFKG